MDYTRGWYTLHSVYLSPYYQPVKHSFLHNPTPSLSPSLSVLAAIAGALPFIGPYWIALPAVLELWLVEGETMSAIAVLTLSLLPMFFIDSIIYGEVEG